MESHSSQPNIVKRTRKKQQQESEKKREKGMNVHTQTYIYEN